MSGARKRSASGEPRSGDAVTGAGTSRPDVPAAAPTGSPYVATVLAWLVPGAGHFWLGRRRRGVAFFALVFAAVLLGAQLSGRLPWIWSGSPLQTLATLGCMGAGLPYFVLRFGWGYEGSIDAMGYEYGSAFLLTAGLMNLLLVLDAWDVANGEKE